jgi:hypothetical protein
LCVEASLTLLAAAFSCRRLVTGAPVFQRVAVGPGYRLGVAASAVENYVGDAAVPVYLVGWGGGGGGRLSIETHAERSKKRNSSALSWAVSGGPAQTPGMLPIGLPPA